MSGPRYNTASPGLGGALKDAMSAIGKTTGGMLGDARSKIRMHKADVEDAFDDQSGQASNAGRQAQSSDSNNGY